MVERLTSRNRGRVTGKPITSDPVKSWSHAAATAMFWLYNHSLPQSAWVSQALLARR